MEEDTFYKMADKEYFKTADVHPNDVYDVKPDYPSNGKYLLVNHRKELDITWQRPAFISLDDAVMWAKNNLNHDDYNVYKLKVIL